MRSGTRPLRARYMAHHMQGYMLHGPTDGAGCKVPPTRSTSGVKRGRHKVHGTWHHNIASAGPCPAPHHPNSNSKRMVHFPRDHLPKGPDTHIKKQLLNTSNTELQEFEQRLGHPYPTLWKVCGYGWKFRRKSANMSISKRI